MCTAYANRMDLKTLAGENVKGIATLVLNYKNADGEPKTVPAVFDKMRLHRNADGRIECKVRVGPDAWMRLGYLRLHGIYNASGLNETDDEDTPCDMDVAPEGVREGEDFHWGNLDAKMQQHVKLQALQMLGYGD